MEFVLSLLLLRWWDWEIEKIPVLLGNDVRELEYLLDEMRSS